MTPAPSAAERPGGADAAPAGFPRTSVLFVHGMGSQKRYGDLSNLVEAIDHHVRDTGQGRLIDIDVKIEPSNQAPGETVGYIDAKWVAAGETEPSTPPFRFYEAYWAPIAADGVPRTQIVVWMFAQVIKPLGALLTPWRQRQRLRRAALHDMSGVSDAQRDELWHAYDSFDGDAARRDYAEGTFDQFVTYVESRGKADPSQSELKGAARRWHRRYLRGEWTNLIFLTTLAVALLTVAAVAILTAAQMVALINDTQFRDFKDTASYIHENWAPLSMVLGLLVVVSGIQGFLVDYIGDVMLWATYEETNARYRKRKEILDCAAQLLRHVVESPSAARVVVVSHSLGTAIAIDSVLRLARDNRALQGQERTDAEKRLRKITHVVTYGCPVDKIHYLFENSGAGGHRYNRVVEDLRGDIGTEPFANNNGKRWVHWVNFWDQADIISGSIETPANRRHPDLVVDNVAVRGARMPNPGSAHTAYLERREVLDGLTEILFRRTTGRCDGPYAPDRPLGPGKGRGWVRAAQWGAGAVIWTLAAGIVWAAACAQIEAIAWTTLGVAGAGIVLVGISSAGAKLRMLGDAVGALWPW